MEQSHSALQPQQPQAQALAPQGARAASAAHALALASGPAPPGAAAAAAAGVVAAPLRTALLCIDVQSDFMPGGAVAVPRGEEVVAVINKLRRSCRDQLTLVVFTQDYHPPNHVSFASTHLPPPPPPQPAATAPQPPPSTDSVDQPPQPQPGARQYVRLVYDKATGELLDCSRCGPNCRARCAPGGANGSPSAAAVVTQAASPDNAAGRHGGGNGASRALLGTPEGIAARGGKPHGLSAPSATAFHASSATTFASPSRAGSLPFPSLALPVPVLVPPVVPVAAGEEGALLHAAEAALAALPHADEPAGGAAEPTESASPRAACRAAYAAAWQLESLAAAASEAASAAASAGVASASRADSGFVGVGAEEGALLAAAVGAVAQISAAGGVGDKGKGGGGAQQLLQKEEGDAAAVGNGASGLCSPLLAQRSSLVGASGATLQRHLEAKMEQVGWISAAPSTQLDSGVSSSSGASGSSSDSSSSGGSSIGGGAGSAGAGREAAMSFEERGKQWQAAAAPAAPAGPAEAAGPQQLQQWALEEAQEQQAVEASAANARARSAAFHQRAWEGDGRQANTAGSWVQPAPPGGGGVERVEAAAAGSGSGAGAENKGGDGEQGGSEQQQKQKQVPASTGPAIHAFSTLREVGEAGEGEGKNGGEVEPDAATQAAIGAAAHAAADAAGTRASDAPTTPTRATPTPTSAAAAPRVNNSAAAAALAGLEVGGAAYPPQPHTTTATTTHPHTHLHHHQDAHTQLHHPRHGTLKHARRPSPRTPPLPPPSPQSQPHLLPQPQPQLDLQPADSQQQQAVVLQRLWPDHCLAGGAGCDLHTGLLAALPSDVILRKGVRRDVDGYSAFFDNGRLHQTPLHRQLRAAGVSRLLVAGVAAEHCVLWTVRDAVRLGYQVWVVSDGVRGMGGPAEAAAREEMAALPAVLMLTAEQVISAAAAWPNAEGLALEPPAAPDPRGQQPHPIQ